MKIQILTLGHKALKSLQLLNRAQLGFISQIVIGTDNKIQNDYSKEIISLCTINKIEYKFRNEFTSLQFDYIIAIGWKWMIKTNKTQKLIIFHDSILPKYRGFNPLVSYLINQEDKIGVTCLFGNDEYDKGDIIAQDSTKIAYPIKIRTAIELISDIYANLFSELITKITTEVEIDATPQIEKDASYSIWRDEEDYYINWNNSSDYIERFINAVGFPYAGARAMMDNTEIIIHEAENVGKLRIENSGIGKVLFKENNFPIIICGSGLLKIKKISDINGVIIPFPNKFRYRFK